MGFIEDLAALTATIRQRVAVVKTEEATKMSLIVPMLQTWGYDPFNPLEVTPEYTADVGTKQKEKVDYAIMRDGEPIILVECKPAGMPLDKHGSQLFRYFSVCPAKIGILTNGVEYRFFSDTEHENKMDLVPFLTVNLLDLKPGQDAQLAKFCREEFDMEALMPSIELLALRRQIQDAIARAFDDPPEELVKYFVRQVYDGSMTGKVMERYTPLVKEGLRTYFNDRINARLQNAISEEAPEDAQVSEDGIETTEDEMNGLRIVQAIASELVDPSRLVPRDNKSYYNILLDDTIRQQVCRLYLNTSNWYIGTYEEKQENRQPLEKLTDIYKHREQILAAIRRYEGDGQ
jgi:hypothetical protein